MHPTKYSLKGRVELVHLKAPVSDECVKGHSQAGEVLVSGARNYVGKDVLVMFDPIQDSEKSLPIGNFLTSKPPEYFTSLNPNEYVLCALWRGYMYKENEEAPIFPELRGYYSFGHAPHFFFLHENSTQTHGRFQVNSNGEVRRLFRHSLGHIVARELPDPNFSSRLIVVEGTNALSQVGKVLTDHHLTPILLEPLK